MHKESTLGVEQLRSKGVEKWRSFTAGGAADAALDAQASASAAACQAENFGCRSGRWRVRAADASAATVDVNPKSEPR